MSNIPFKPSEYENVRDSLNDFLSNQSEFTDHNFEGSALSTIVKLLAFNDQYIQYIASMYGNEMFSDTAQIPASINSHAKRVGYLPKSSRSSKININIVVTPSDIDEAEPVLKMPKGTKFISRVDNEFFNFVNTQDYSAILKDGVYTFTDVLLIQGKYLEHIYTVGSNDKFFGIPNTSVDIDYMDVNVQTSENDTTVIKYNKANDITSINSTSLIYFLQKNAADLYEIEFGDGILGSSIDVGNLVIIDYVVTKGELANNIKTIDSLESIGDYNNIYIDVISSSSGGASAESIDSVKSNMKKFSSIQNRAVTQSDYAELIRNNFSNVVDVRVWGGEDNIPPEYGVVFISAVNTFKTDLTTSEKDNITSFLSKYNVGSIKPKYVDPTYIKLKLDVYLSIDETLLDRGINNIKTLVENAILDFSDTQLSKFDNKFRSSILTNNIDNTHSSITNSTFDVKIINSIDVKENFNQSIEISFNNEIVPTTFSSTKFRVNDPSLPSNISNIHCFVDDGLGNINIIRDDNIVVKSKFGSIDYLSGIVKIYDFNPLSLSSDFEITAEPNILDVEISRSNIAKITADLINISVDIE